MLFGYYYSLSYSKNCNFVLFGTNWGMPHFDPKFQKMKTFSLNLRPDNYSFRERKK